MRKQCRRRNIRAGLLFYFYPHGQYVRLDLHLGLVEDGHVVYLQYYGRGYRYGLYKIHPGSILALTCVLWYTVLRAARRCELLLPQNGPTAKWALISKLRPFKASKHLNLTGVRISPEIAVTYTKNQYF